MATITVADLAADLNTDARTARKFLRSITPKDSQPGKGSRWAIEKREVRSLRSKFSKFQEAEEARRAAKASKVEEVEATDEVDTIDDIDLDSLEGPTADDLALLENED